MTTICEANIWILQEADKALPLLKFKKWGFCLEGFQEMDDFFGVDMPIHSWNAKTFGLAPLMRIGKSFS